VSTLNMVELSYGSHLHLCDIQVRIFQEDGEHVGKNSFQILAVDKSRLKLFKGRTSRAKEEYSSSMQVCIQKL
jgi:hypothetical protein